MCIYSGTRISFNIMILLLCTYNIQLKDIIQTSRLLTPIGDHPSSHVENSRSGPKLESFVFLFLPLNALRMVFAISDFDLPLSYRKKIVKLNPSSFPPFLSTFSKRRCCWTLWAGLFSIKKNKNNPPRKRGALELWTWFKSQFQFLPFTHWLGNLYLDWYHSRLFSFHISAVADPVIFVFCFFFLRNRIPELAIGLNPTCVQFQSSFESLHLHRISGLSAGLALLNSDIYHIVLLVSDSQGSIPLTSGEGFW